MLCRLTLQLMSIKQFCFFVHFLIDFTNQCWNSANIVLNCNVNYYFDYLDGKSIFFTEKKKNKKVAFGWIYLVGTKKQFR